ncbi:MAG TPA: cytochrome c biogenesis protein CcsA [Burkholderiales bacterium]|nr:cytochrome c biogenesis protein CcsA [Betaproteobacteria bacterium]HQR51774.1 cytochrome c biogenesis protein CcsA [Burkholderiales bacterium]
MPSILLHLINALLYAGGGAYFWRTRWRFATVPAISTEVRQSPGWEHAVILVPLALHAWLLYSTMFKADGLYLGVGTALSAIAWLTMLIYWLASLFYRQEGLQTLILPVAAVAVLLPVIFPALKPLAHTEVPAFKFHLVLSMLAYSLFTIASLHVLLMALLERRLHGGAVKRAPRWMPPLLTMEALLFRIIGAGFVLLTLVLVSGIFFSEEVFGKPLSFSHKTIFAFLSWGIFAALLAGRSAYGWRGRVAVRWTLAGFLTLVLAYLGSKFVLEILLGRG